MTHLERHSKPQMYKWHVDNTVRITYYDHAHSTAQRLPKQAYITSIKQNNRTRTSTKGECCCNYETVYYYCDPVSHLKMLVATRNFLSFEHAEPLSCVRCTWLGLGCGLSFWRNRWVSHFMEGFPQMGADLSRKRRSGQGRSAEL